MKNNIKLTIGTHKKIERHVISYDIICLTILYLLIL